MDMAATMTSVEGPEGCLQKTSEKMSQYHILLRKSFLCVQTNYPFKCLMIFGFCLKSVSTVEIVFRNFERCGELLIRNLFFGWRFFFKKQSWKNIRKFLQLLSEYYRDKYHYLQYHLQNILKGSHGVRLREKL